MYVKLCKLFVAAFLLYSTWYSQIWGANQMILYSSVGLSIFFLLLDAALVLMRLDLRKINPMVKMYVVFGVYAALTGVVFAVDRGEFLASVFTYVSFTIIAFEIWYVSFRADSFKWVLNLIYALAWLCALTTIFNGQEYQSGVIVTTMGEYNNPNTLGVLMVFGIFAAVFQKEGFNKYFVFKYFSVFVFLYVILLSGSRKALFAGVGLFVMWVAEYFIESRARKVTPKTIFTAAIIILSIMGAIKFLQIVYVEMAGFERLMLLFEEGGTAKRLQLMEAAVQYWKQSPIFGIGLDQFRIWNENGFYSHSTYAEILSCTGIFGCLIFFLPLLKLLVVSVKKAFEKREDAYEMRICLLMLGAELFLGVGQIFIYSATHMIMLVFIANIVYEEIGCNSRKKKVKLRFKPNYY